MVQLYRPAQPTEPINMKPLRSLILLCIMGACATASDDSWLTPPDGFVWPRDAAIKLKSETELLVSGLPAKVQSYLKNQYEPQSPPMMIHACRGDLNGDGVMEWFIDRPEYGGSGGGFYDIVDVSCKNARSIGGLQGGFRLCVAAPKEKWLRIECSRRSGGEYLSRDLLQYKGGEYQTVRSEAHDLIHNKVTLGK